MAKRARPAARVSEQDRRWAAESAMETLARAEAIQKDRRLMTDVKKLASERIASLQKVAGKTPAGRKKA
jgi:hypothetical protein